MIQQEEVPVIPEPNSMPEKSPPECYRDSLALFEQYRKCSPQELERVIAAADGEVSRMEQPATLMPLGDTD